MKKIIFFITLLGIYSIHEAPAQVAQGLVSKYSFNNATTQDEAGVNHLLSNATATYGTDRFGHAGQAFICNGTDAFLKTDTRFFDPSKPYTISMWFRTDDSLRTQQTLFNTDPHRHIVAGYNYYNNNTFDIGLGDGVNWTICKTFIDLDTLNAGGLPVTKWNNIIVTYNGSEWKYYIDANYQKTCNGGVPTPDSTNLHFGAIAWSWWQLLHGEIDDITIYNKALTQTQIDSVFEDPDPATSRIGSSVKMNEMINFYPNPVNGKIYFSKPAHVQLSNISGQIIYQGRFVQEMNISSLSDGLYIISFTDLNGKIIQRSKVIKQ